MRGKPIPLMFNYDLFLNPTNLCFFQPLATLGHETINTPIYTQMDATHGHIMTDFLSRFTLIGQPNLGGKAIKILRLAAFAPDSPSCNDYNLRVYFIEDTQDALDVSLFLSFSYGSMSGNFIHFSGLGNCIQEYEFIVRVLDHQINRML